MIPVTSVTSAGRLALSGALLFTLAATPAALASGSRVGFKDPFAMARGNAFVATADNPSAVYYNPAGLARLEGAQIAANLYQVAVSSDYQGAGGTAALDDDFQTVPSFYASWKPAGASWALGLGVYAPFGLSTEWPAASPLRTFALKNEQTYLTYNVSGAWQVNDRLSLGAGLTYNRVDTDLRRALGFLAPNDLFRYNGDGDALGFNLGVLWKISEQHQVGLSYSHRTRIKTKGVTDTIPLIAGEPSTATFDFPEVVIVGWSYRPTPAWNLEVNLDWTNWNRFGTVVIEKASGNTPIAFNWDSGLFYEFGATRYLNANWNVSAGLCYTENSVPDATYTPAVPDSDRLFYSLGVGYRSDLFSVDLAWHYGDGGNRRVTGSPPSMIGATADGSYDNAIQAFALSATVKF